MLYEVITIKAGRQKAILSDAMSDLISQSIAKRRKSGFELPFGRWLSGVLNERVITSYSIHYTKLYDLR